MEKSYDAGVDFDPLTEVKTKIENKDKSPSDRLTAIILDLLSRPEEWESIPHHKFKGVYSHIKTGLYIGKDTGHDRLVLSNSYADIIGPGENSKIIYKSYKDFLIKNKQLAEAEIIDSLERKLVNQNPKRETFLFDKPAREKGWLILSIVSGICALISIVFAQYLGCFVFTLIGCGSIFNYCDD